MNMLMKNDNSNIWSQSKRWEKVLEFGKTWVESLRSDPMQQGWETKKMQSETLKTTIMVENVDQSVCTSQFRVDS